MIARCCIALAALLIVNSISVGMATTKLDTLSSADLEPFLDPLMQDYLEHHKIAGAVIVVVHDGETVLAKGYGYADIENKRPMTADATLVRPGSISKLFTGIAVMQLVEQGELDLDQDVNDYLDFAIPTPSGGVPVTLRRLLTHRAGFEEVIRDLFTKEPAPQSLDRWVANYLPPRLFPNGDVGAYSNYGLALAGYIAERVADQPFADYVKESILEPLGMVRSTFRQPLPEDLAPMMAKSYDRSDEPPLEFFETIPPAPAGALSATGADMGRFMQALLNGGEIDGTRILSEKSIAQMMTPEVTAPTGKLGLVFYETRLAGQSLIGHNGGTMAFFSNLLLSPENDVGLFISYDGFAWEEGSKDPVKAFFQRYFPEAPKSSKPIASGSGEARVFAGNYWTSRRAESTLMKLAYLGSQLLFWPSSDGSLKVHPAVWPFGDAVMSLTPVGPGLFESDDDQVYAFERLPDQRVRLLSGAPVSEFGQVPWQDDARLTLPLVITSSLVAALTLVAWPVAALVRRLRRRQSQDDWTVRRDQHAVRLVLFLQLSAIIAAVVLYVVLSEDDTFLIEQLDPVFLTVYGAAWLGSLGSIITLWVAWRFWRKRIGSLWKRLHHTMLAGAAVTLAWFLVNWNIAGTTLNY